MKNKSSLVLPILIIFLVIVCIGVMFGVNFLLSMPTQAEILFGQPVPSSNLVMDIYNATFLVCNKEVLITNFGNEDEEIRFEIYPGENALSVAINLEEAGVISHAGVFVKYLQYKGYDRILIANQYILPTGLTAVEVAARLLDPEPEFIPIMIYPGLRYEEFSKLFDYLFINFDENQFDSALLQAGSDIGIVLSSGHTQSYAALLLPGQYTLHRNLDTYEITSEILSKFKAEISIEIQDGIESTGLTFEQGLVLASIVEREALHKEEMPMIASVFHNRLAISMKLEADPTIQYALGYQPAEDSWWKSALTYNDLGFDSPYNTYIYPGLPPTPICNPSIEALQAVAFPEITDYFFFRTTCDNTGYHSFAKTYEEHLANACP